LVRTCHLEISKQALELQKHWNSQEGLLAKGWPGHAVMVMSVLGVFIPVAELDLGGCKGLDMRASWMIEMEVDRLPL
jgi:hypothetical protein